MNNTHVTPRALVDHDGCDLSTYSVVFTVMIIPENGWYANLYVFVWLMVIWRDSVI